MIAVSNTSPLNYLVLINTVDLLHQLFGTIIIPPAVHDELSDTDAPDPVQRWIARQPDWLEVRKVAQHADAELKHLHHGCDKN